MSTGTGVSLFRREKKFGAPIVSWWAGFVGTKEGRCGQGSEWDIGTGTSFHNEQPLSITGVTPGPTRL